MECPDCDTELEYKDGFGNPGGTGDIYTWKCISCQTEYKTTETGEIIDN